MGKNVYTILADTVGEKATITEADVWDAIGEAYCTTDACEIKLIKDNQ